MESSHQFPRQPDYDDLEGQVREFAWQSGYDLASLLTAGRVRR
jgi:hypothetical protein